MNPPSDVSCIELGTALKSDEPLLNHFTNSTPPLELSRTPAPSYVLSHSILPSESSFRTKDLPPRQQLPMKMVPIVMYPPSDVCCIEPQNSSLSSPAPYVFCHSTFPSESSFRIQPSNSVMSALPAEPATTYPPSLVCEIEDK